MTGLECTSGQYCESQLLSTTFKYRLSWAAAEIHTPTRYVILARIKFENCFSSKMPGYGSASIEQSLRRMI